MYQGSNSSPSSTTSSRLSLRIACSSDARTVMVGDDAATASSSGVSPSLPESIDKMEEDEIEVVGEQNSGMFKLRDELLESRRRNILFEALVQKEKHRISKLQNIALNAQNKNIALEEENKQLIDENKDLKLQLDIQSVVHAMVSTVSDTVLNPFDEAFCNEIVEKNIEAMQLWTETLSSDILKPSSEIQSLQQELLTLQSDKLEVDKQLIDARKQLQSLEDVCRQYSYPRYGCDVGIQNIQMSRSPSPLIILNPQNGGGASGMPKGTPNDHPLRKRARCEMDLGEEKKRSPLLPFPPSLGSSTPYTPSTPFRPLTVPRRGYLTPINPCISSSPIPSLCSPLPLGDILDNRLNETKQSADITMSDNECLQNRVDVLETALKVYRNAVEMKKENGCEKRKLLNCLVDAFTNHVKITDEVMDSLREEKSLLSSRLSSSRSENLLIRKEMVSLGNRLTNSREKGEELEEEAHCLREQMATVNQSLESQRKEVEEMNSVQGMLLQHEQQLQGQLEEAHEVAKKAIIESRSLHKENATLEEEKKNLSVAITSIETNNRKVIADFMEQKKRVIYMEDKVKSLEKSIEMLNETNYELRSSQQKSCGECAVLRREIREYESQLAVNRTIIDHVSSKVTEQVTCKECASRKEKMDLLDMENSMSRTLIDSLKEQMRSARETEMKYEGYMREMEAPSASYLAEHQLIVEREKHKSDLKALNGHIAILSKSVTLKDLAVNLRCLKLQQDVVRVLNEEMSTTRDEMAKIGMVCNRKAYEDQKKKGGGSSGSRGRGGQKKGGKGGGRGGSAGGRGGGGAGGMAPGGAFGGNMPPGGFGFPGGWNVGPNGW